MAGFFFFFFSTSDFNEPREASNVPSLSYYFVHTLSLPQLLKKNVWINICPIFKAIKVIKKHTAARGFSLMGAVRTRARTDVAKLRPEGHTRPSELFNPAC